MEAYLAKKLTEDAEMQAFFDPRGPESWYFVASSLGEGENPERPEHPFVIWNELPDRTYDEVRKASNARMRSFNITVQDDKGDFTRINNILYVIRRIVKEMSPFHLEDGTICTDSLWGGISGNFTDPQYDSGLKFGIARFTVSR